MGRAPEPAVPFADVDWNFDPMMSNLIIGSVSIMIWLWGFFVMFPDKILLKCNFSFATFECAGYTTMFLTSQMVGGVRCYFLYFHFSMIRSAPCGTMWLCSGRNLVRSCS